MASLHFIYSAMNAGKSSQLLQVAHNYEEREMNVELFTFVGDNRYGFGSISSRIGLRRPSLLFYEGLDLYETILTCHKNKKLSCVLIDEAQFLSKEQVDQLGRLADEISLPVMCYGLRTDFQGNLFEGSAALMAKADKLVELKTICWCGRKAGMVLRLDSHGNVVQEGAQVVIGGNESYVSVCRKHFTEKKASNA